MLPGPTKRRAARQLSGAGLATFCLRLEPFDKGAEGGCTPFEMPCHVDQSLAVGEGLLASRPKSDAGMRPQGLEQHGDGLGDRAVVAPDVKPPQEFESVGDFHRDRI